MGPVVFVSMIDFTQPLLFAFFSELTAAMPFGRLPSLSLFALIANQAPRRYTRLQRASSLRCLDQEYPQQSLTTAANMDQSPPREVGSRARVRTRTTWSNLPTGKEYTVTRFKDRELRNTLVGNDGNYLL